MDICNLIKQLITIKNGNISVADIEAFVFLIQKELKMDVGAKFDFRFGSIYSEEVSDCLRKLENKGVIRIIERTIEEDGYKIRYATDYIILEPVPIDKKIADYVNQFKEKLKANDYVYQFSHQT